MHITMNNHNDAPYEALLDDLIRAVFGFSFTPWFEQNQWDERYESYSFIENGRMLANVCIFKTDLLIGGKPVRAHQFGGVATRKSERGRGLARLLMEHILAKYPATPAFLAANPDVMDFYPRFGFRRAQTYRPEITADIDHPTGNARQLRPDSAFLAHALENRRMYSNVLDSANTQPIQMFHLLLDYPDGIYHLPGCAAIVVAEQNGDRLFLADVIAGAPVAFDAIRRELPVNGVRRVEFGFCPDWLGVTPAWEPVDGETSPYFIRGDWDLPHRYRFPALSET